MSKLLGNVSAYAYAVSQGYTGTEEEFAELMASYASVAEAAAASAESAAGSATSASGSASAASAKATEAANSASAAATSASNAAASATNAAGSASAAAGSASTASGKANEASASATAAAGSASTASAKASEAATSATNAAASATAAGTAQTAAETAAESVEASAAQIETNKTDITHLKQDINELETGKADASGTSENLTAGNAEQLMTDKGITEKVPYLLRASGGNGADREEDKIVGGTVAWNQLVNFTDRSSTISGISLTRHDGVIFEYSGTAAANNYIDVGAFTADDSFVNSIVVGHRYLLVANSSDTRLYMVINNPYTDMGYPSVTTAVIYTPTSAPTYLYVRIKCSNGETLSGRGGIGVFDLTQMFGTAIADRAYAMEQATAGSGIAWLKSMGFFQKDYYPYDAGTLKSVEGLAAHSMVGFNQWDEEWELGTYATDDGTPSASSNHIRCKNPIPALPNTTYYFNTGGVNAHICFMDANMNFISSHINVNGATLTSPSNCGYIEFNTGQAYGTTYNHDICINLSDPAKNGEYEPYKTWSYPLDSDLTLRGIPKLDANNQVYYDGDEYAADGTVARRYGVVDLGTLNWTLHSSGAFYATLSDGKPIASQNVATPFICSKYSVVVTGSSAAHSTENKVIWQGISQGACYAYVRDSAYSTAADFKTAMSGVYLVYELATPTTDEADPYQNPQIVDPYGTEAYETIGIVPVGHETFYPENLRSKIEGLPFNFATLIAPTESTYKATRAYTTGNLFIVNNILYKATTSIASGGTITPGTNCIATTLAEIIAALS